MNIDKLDKQTLKLVNRIVRGGVNYLSGTMAPAKSNPETMDIECLGHAFEHYAKRGVDRVIVQPKYMGSRCQVYINKDLDKCYAVSRNGFKIKKDLSNIFKERHEFWFGGVVKGVPQDAYLIIEDGELMPWMVLGEGLIEESFGRYVDLAESELKWLEEDRFLTKRAQTITMLRKKGDNITKQEKRTLEALQNFKNPVLASRNLLKFRHQLALFGKSGEPYFKPFNILKMVGDKEVIVQDLNSANFSIVSEDPYAIIDPSNWEKDPDLTKLLEWVKEEELEGVVVKPCVYQFREDKEQRYAPYLKVRNPEYLHLVYGPDYREEEKLKALVEKKSIGRKVGASIREYEIGTKLLEIPAGLLDNRNQHYKELVAEAVMQFKRDEELDPRL